MCAKFERDWSMGAKFVNHSMLNSSQFSNEKRIFTLIMDEISMSSENCEGNGYMHGLDLLIILH